METETIDTKIDDIGITSLSRTYKEWKPCGNLNITFAYKEGSKIDYVLINGNDKTNQCGNSFITTIADFLTFSIRRIRNKYEVHAIIKNLKGHRCNRMRANKDHILSCADSIGRAIEKELSNEEG